VPVEYFLPNPQQQWYFERLVVIVVAALLAAAVVGVLLRRQNFVPAFLFAVYAAYLGFFALLSETFFHTRHLLTTELWYIPVLGVGLYLIWKAIGVLRPQTGKLMTGIIAVVLAVCTINAAQILMPISSTDPDNPISEDYLHDMTKVHEFMIGHVQPQDVLISTVYGLYSSWTETPAFEERYRITTETPHQKILALIDQHPSGWIAIDQIRLQMFPQGERGFAGNPDVKFVGQFGDEYVWRWQHSTGGFGNPLVAGKGQ
jgi:hypothetical protein